MMGRSRRAGSETEVSQEAFASEEDVRLPEEEGKVHIGGIILAIAALGAAAYIITYMIVRKRES